jgi:hypothetical protein
MCVSSRSSISGSYTSSRSSRAMSARSVSRWALTETYSPAAMDIAPATSPAEPATMMEAREPEAAATPIMMLAVDTMPSSAPRIAARSHPARRNR